MEIPFPHNEEQRQAILDSYGILYGNSERLFDDLVLIARSICTTPMAAITFIDKDIQWIKSRSGLDATQTTRKDSFCTHAIMEPTKVMVVEDATEDDRFRNNVLVVDDPHLRFYAGAPLVTSEGVALGSICVLDHKPGKMEPHQLMALEALARQVVALIELKRVSSELDQKVREQAWYEDTLRMQNASLVSQNQEDPLTGLGNRRAWQAATEPLSEHHENSWVAVIDIDHFKTINDTHGHAHGDEVLVRLAQILKKHTRAEDTLVRFGGEEFAWLLNGFTQQQAVERAEALRSQVQALDWKTPLTISIGLAPWNEGQSAEDAFRRADTALYKAKSDGRNRVQVN